MARTRWKDTAGMPLRTRVFCVAASLAERVPLTEMTPEYVAAHRPLSPLPTFPASLVIGRRAPGVVSSDLTIPVRDGSTIRGRLHHPPQVGETAPVFVYYHGGGWARGRPKDYESLLSEVVASTGAIVVAPDYRKAPQHKAPAAVHDAIDTLRWVAGAPAELPATPGRIALGGDSAGGNLTALVAQWARDHDGPPLVGQVLIYPATDLHRHHPMRTAPMLDGPSMDRYKELYLDGAEVADDDPSVSPIHCRSLAGLPPALVQTADHDPLRDEGKEYADLLAAQGVSVRYTGYRGVPHGFLNLPGVAPAAVQARAEIIDQLEDWFRE
ncbi:alpha/beta hydrolase fold domain-containing protein [Metallococcus carri]|uniref:alpha/beta hydrolase fold domain-containing protein n=1 Tax=Metallococcus carri TaxID=1656884 RepID=UPI001F1F5659|nr:alpha/beta hydrolase fold domain-containing protein [Metallococcus carri]